MGSMWRYTKSWVWKSSKKSPKPKVEEEELPKTQIHDTEMMDSIKSATVKEPENCTTHDDVINYLDTIIESLHEEPPVVPLVLPPKSPSLEECASVYADLPSLESVELPLDVDEIIKVERPDSPINVELADSMPELVPADEVVDFSDKHVEIRTPSPVKLTRLRRRRRPPTPRTVRMPDPEQPLSYSADRVTRSKRAKLTATERIPSYDELLSELERGNLHTCIDIPPESPSPERPISSLLDKLIEDDEPEEETTVCEEIREVWTDIKLFFSSLCSSQPEPIA